MADFNQDGNLDVAVPTSFLGRVSVFLGNGDGTLCRIRNIARAGGAASVETADMNNDGIPDIEVANSQS